MNDEGCVNRDFFQTCLLVQTSSWHISVSVACVWLTDAPWARRGLRLRSKCARGNGQVWLHVWYELARTDWQPPALAQSDSNHNLTSFSPVSLAPAPLSPVHHAWLPRVTRVFTNLHTYLLTVRAAPVGLSLLSCLWGLHMIRYTPTSSVTEDGACHLHL